MTMIKPNENDILCGKSRDCVSAPGSVHFRNIIDTYALQYVNAKSKYDKMTITKEIYESVCETSRFLKYNEAMQCWEEISLMAARDKVGHALRFAGRTTTRRNKKIHRSGSLSSSSSSSSASSQSETNGFRRSSLMGQLRQGMPNEFPAVVNEEDPVSLLLQQNLFTESKSSSSSCNNNINRDENIDMSTVDELRLLLQEEQFEFSDPLADITDDLLDFVQHMDSSNLMTLLSEPVGEWQD